MVPKSDFVMKVPELVVRELQELYNAFPSPVELRDRLEHGVRWDVYKQRLQEALQARPEQLRLPAWSLLPGASKSAHTPTSCPRPVQLTRLPATRSRH